MASPMNMSAADWRAIAPEHGGKRIVIAHLGNGASLCAIQEGRSVASDHGFHGRRRAGDGHALRLDRSGRAHLSDGRDMAWMPARWRASFYKKSGLLGVSGISSDMRSLRGSDDPKAREAIDLFIYRIVARDRLAVGGARRAGGTWCSRRHWPARSRGRARRLSPDAPGWERTWTSSATQLVMG